MGNCYPFFIFTKTKHHADNSSDPFTPGLASGNIYASKCNGYYHQRIFLGNNRRATCGYSFMLLSIWLPGCCFLFLYETLEAETLVQTHVKIQCRIKRIARYEP